MNPATTRPPCPGLYEVGAPIAAIRTPTKFYAWWSGKLWSPASRSPEKAADPIRLAVAAVVQNKPWKDVE